MPEQYYFKYSDITIGVVIKEDRELNYVPNIPAADKLPAIIGYPPGIFQLDRTKTPWMPCKTKVSNSTEILNWFIKRSFSKDRPDIKGILELLGLTSYDAWEIIKRTKALSKSDCYWLTQNEDESYKKPVLSILD